jgi:hypothetical protein
MELGDLRGPHRVRFKSRQADLFCRPCTKDYIPSVLFGGRTRTRTWDPLIKSAGVGVSPHFVLFPVAALKGRKPPSCGHFSFRLVFSCFGAYSAQVLTRC